MMSAMVDIETFSTANDAAVISIGMVCFSEEEIVSSIYLSLYPAHGDISASTVLWWLGQNDDARKILTSTATIPDESAATEIANFVATWRPEEIWANGPNFDLIVLENWWARIKPRYEWPFNFRKYRDFRTLMALARECGVDIDRISPSTAHNALADATAQAQYVILQKKAFKEKLNVSKGS